MTPRETKTVRDWAAATAPSGTRILLAAGGHTIDAAMQTFCVHLQQAAPGLIIINDPDKAFRKPALIIGRYLNIAYQAIPVGLELAPFLETLSMDGADFPRLTARTEDLLNKMAVPADLTLYISTHCPHCPEAVRRWWPLAAASAKIRLTIVDATHFEAQTRAAGVRSVPALILDDTWRWSANTKVDEILSVCLQRNPALISPASLRRIIEDGDAAGAARMMMENGGIFPALIALLADEKWSVRLGAMVVAEYLADTAPALADEVAFRLWRDFDTLTPQVQGDAAYIFGRIGSRTAMDCLKKIAAGPYASEVRQAAEEELT